MSNESLLIREYADDINIPEDIFHHQEQQVYCKKLKPPQNVNPFCEKIENIAAMQQNTNILIQRIICTIAKRKNMNSLNYSILKS